ncbi:MAG: hypothetical protein P4L22_03170 [Candidatus Babeliales bacterium]|nr:hypothetical protein [Candidatus Babeliales bacterium]
MKKILVALLIFTFNVFAKQFTLVNQTQFTIQPFLDPVKITGNLPNGTSINKYTIPGYIKNGQIIFLQPDHKLIIVLTEETRDNLNFEFYTATKFKVKANLPNNFGFGQIIDSEPVEIEDNEIYILYFDENDSKIRSFKLAKSGKVENVETYTSSISSVASNSPIKTLEDQIKDADSYLN